MIIIWRTLIKVSKIEFIESIYTLIFTCLGFYSTYFLIEMNYNSILSSALIGFSGCLLCGKKCLNYKLGSEVIYCSSFAAIGVKEILNSHVEISILLILLTVVFITSKNVYRGFGGKLGTIAFITTYIIGSVLSFP